MSIISELSTAQAKVRRLEVEVERLRATLEQIKDGGECFCDHNDDQCCARVGYFCHQCIAAVALRGGGK